MASSLISVSEFKAKFLAYFRLMRDTGAYVDIHNRGEVYRVHVQKLGKRVQRNYKRRSYVNEIKTERCPECDKLMVNGVCMNAKCFVTRS